MSFPATTTFGNLLKQLRKRAGMTQGDLAAAVGYSVSLICALEQNRRLPDVQTMQATFVPALALQEEPQLAAQLVELAAQARGERPPVMMTRQRNRQWVITEEQRELDPLPALPPPLIGRQPLVQMLCQRLQGHSGRLLTLVGPPGIGKTRVGLAMVTQLQNLYKDGAYFVALATLNDPTLLADTLVVALGLSDASPKPAKTKLIEFIRRKDLLLLLDNFEQISAAAPLVAELLATCPGLHVIVTSRERLQLRAEQRYKVPPLDLSAAVDLFVQRAQTVSVDFALTPANQATIVAICQKLDCLPLAIELSAAHCALLSTAQLLQQLDVRPLDLLSDGAHGRPEYPHTLRQAIQRSYQMLLSPEQRLLCTLGLFKGGFTIQAVEHLGFDGALLQALLHKSLVTDLVGSVQGDEDRRFGLLETIRLFAVEHLAQSGETAATYQAFVDYFRTLAKTAAQYKETVDRKVWLNRLRAELDNLRTALHIALAHQLVEAAAAIVTDLYWVWYALGLVAEGRRWVNQVLQQLSAPTVPALYATTLATAGRLAALQGEWPTALAYFQASMNHYAALQDEENFINAQASYSEALLDTGDAASALVSIQDCVARLRQWQNGDAPAAIGGEVCCVYARILVQQAHLAAARTQLEQSLAYFQQAHDRTGYAYVLYLLAQIEMREGLPTAQAKYRASLEIYLAQESYLLAACNYHFLGYLDRLGERYAAALHNDIAGLKLFIRMGNVGSIVGSLTEIAKVAVVQQHYRIACQLLGKADFLREAIGEKQWKAFPAEREEYERYVALLTQTLGPELFAESWQQGQTLAVEDLVDSITATLANALYPDHPAPVH